MNPTTESAFVRSPQWSQPVTTDNRHPMLRSKRPLIITRPGERLAGDAKNSIEIGSDAIWIVGQRSK